VDLSLFGQKPSGHHLINVLVHLANSILLLWVIARLTGAFWQSALVAALFALHPMNVEPVAWISSRKDVLCMLFLLCSISFYASYVKAARDEKSGRAWKVFHYTLALSCFVAALMSKAVAATLPFVLLLLDYWPLARFKASEISIRDPGKPILRVLWEKLPFFALAAVFAWLGSNLLQGQGATANYGDLGFGNRAANGIVSYARYLGKFIWPGSLSVFYPRPPTWPAWEVILSLGLILGCTVLAVVSAAKRPYLFVGWFWFVGTLLPVVGIVHQMGGHAMADRYAYIAYPGLFVGIAFAASGRLSGSKFGRVFLTLTSIAVLCVLFARTTVQVTYWQNSEALFRHALAVDNDNAVAHNHLGSALSDQGRLQEAEGHFAEALRIRPDFPYAEINYAMALARKENYEGVNILTNLLKKHPNDEEAHYSLGLILQKKGEIAAAITQYHEALRLRPNDADALNNLAWIRAANANLSFRSGEEAVRLARQACELTHYQNPVMIGTLAAAHAEAGQFKEAVAAAQKAGQVAKALGQVAVAEQNRKLVELYEAGKAFHEKE